MKKSKRVWNRAIQWTITIHSSKDLYFSFAFTTFHIPIMSKRNVDPQNLNSKINTSYKLTKAKVMIQSCRSRRPATKLRVLQNYRTKLAYRSWSCVLVVSGKTHWLGPCCSCVRWGTCGSKGISRVMQPTSFGPWPGLFGILSWFLRGRSLLLGSLGKGFLLIIRHIYWHIARLLDKEQIFLLKLLYRWMLLPFLMGRSVCVYVCPFMWEFCFFGYLVSVKCRILNGGIGIRISIWHTVRSVSGSVCWHLGNYRYWKSTVSVFTLVNTCIKSP